MSRNQLKRGQKKEKKQVEVNKDNKDDFVEEDVVNQMAEKLKVNDSEYLDSSDPGEYCDNDDSSDGILLVVEGRDGNNQMFSIARAVVESEGKESWRWFLHKLMVDLEHPNDNRFTLMSDMQKGLIPVLRESFPDVKHRMCERHIYAYWKKMEKNYMEHGQKTPLEHWSKAYFKGSCKCDVVDNSMDEAFNGWIVEARCKPIINMLENIRVMVITMMETKITWVEKWRTNISPRALEKLERNMNISTQCRLIWNGDGGFEVNTNATTSNKSTTMTKKSTTSTKKSTTSTKKSTTSKKASTSNSPNKNEDGPSRKMKR
ncbi:uncharacterized protein LOC120184379 [Hibiscus syriacus]|uniref:uncharacterized protein LOC120184379 n=1 Tax=Hibiscus syriacus TaxID=106335 RepID=UPI001920A33F|nr:uncharacterized protein LOC120184379 [Hibiscus syriacus]